MTTVIIGIDAHKRSHTAVIADTVGRQLAVKTIGTTSADHYEDLLREVLARGTPKADRTGTGMRSLFGRQLRFDLARGFPLVTTKRVHFKSVAVELLWFLRGDSNIQWMQNQGVSIWDEWADPDGELGLVYGVQWRSWPAPDGRHIDQIAAVMDSLKVDPYSRRHIVSAWNVAEIPGMALPPCHAFFQFHVEPMPSGPDRLSCQLYQRSADLFLGVPFNIGAYSLLTRMIADQLGLAAGKFIWTGRDCHIYDNHVDQVREQISRAPFPSPRLSFRRRPDTLFDYTWEDLQLLNYRHHPAITAPVAVETPSSRSPRTDRMNRGYGQLRSEASTAGAGKR